MVISIYHLIWIVPAAAGLGMVVYNRLKAADDADNELSKRNRADRRN